MQSTLSEARVLGDYPGLAEQLPRIAPLATAEELARIAGLPDSVADSVSPEMARLSTTHVQAWQDLDEETATAYAAALVRAANIMRRVAPWKVPVPLNPGVPHAIKSPRQIGPYEATAFLGMGGTGYALRARHVETGQVVTVKLNAKSDVVACDWLGDKLPPAFLRQYEWGIRPMPPGRPCFWQAREYAEETWHGFMARRRGGSVGMQAALVILGLACEGVAALHAQRVYQWSAHKGNVFRVGVNWKLGDLGRCVIASGPDDPRFVDHLGFDLSPADRSSLLDDLEGGPWKADRMGGIMPCDPDREHRLRQDDCAMLGGLLCDLLGLNRWELFYQALRSKPLCSGRYNLTGNKRTDQRLSAILNRCWRGDAGGALLVANRGRGEQATYDDPRELLADVQQALVRTHGGYTDGMG